MDSKWSARAASRFRPSVVKAVARQLPRPPAPSTPVGWAASRQPTRAEHLLARLEASKRATPKPRSKSPGRESEADRHAELLAAIANLGAQVTDVSLRVTHLEDGSGARLHAASGSEGGSDGYNNST